MSRIALLLLTTLGLAQAQVIVGAYPRLDVTPAAPVVGDEVSIYLALGMHSNSCTPAYRVDSTRIDMSPILIYPPRYNVSVSYQAYWPVQDPVCLEVMTEHGPSFGLGALALGSYYVYDGDSLVGAFSVAEACSVGGIVVNDVGASRMMAHPLDSVMVRIFSDYSIYLDAQAPIPFPGVQYSDSFLTGVDGLFEFPRVPAGMYRVSFAKRGYIAQAIALTAPPDTVLDIRLIPDGGLAVIRGAVAASCNNGLDTLCLQPTPMPGCTVWVALPCDYWILPMDMYAPILCERLCAVTDSLGEYVLDSVPIMRSGERVSVSVYPQGYAGEYVDTLIRYGLPTTVNFELDRANLPVMGAQPGTVTPVSAVQRGSGPGQLTVRAAESQVVRLAVYGMDGRRVSGGARDEWVRAGTQTLTVPSFGATGTHIVAVTVDGRQYAILWGAHRAEQRRRE